jgi:hypothetical protein
MGEVLGGSGHGSAKTGRFRGHSDLAPLPAVPGRLSLSVDVAKTERLHALLDSLVRI